MEEDAEERPELIQDAKKESGGENKEEQLSETEAGAIEFAREITDLDKELFQGGREKERQTRRQKRAGMQQHAEKQNLHPLDLSMQEIQQLQEEDETLATVRKEDNAIRKTAEEEGKNWDKLLPYLLFAYREVPQASPDSNCYAGGK